MRRKQATALIDEIRTIVATWQAQHAEANHAMAILANKLARAGLEPLEPCSGAAHSNAHIDQCSVCAPRWGFVGPVEVVS